LAVVPGGLTSTKGVHDVACGRSLSAAIEGCARGEESALGSLFDCCGILATTLAAERIGDPALRCDAVVEIFLRLWRRAPLYDREYQSAPHWLLSEIGRALDDVDAPAVTHPLFARTAAG
jgi:hypothetical protein